MQTRHQTQVRVNNNHMTTLMWIKEQYGLNSYREALSMIVDFAATPEGNQALKQFIKAMKPKPESIFPLAEFHADR